MNVLVAAVVADVVLVIDGGADADIVELLPPLSLLLWNSSSFSSIDCVSGTPNSDDFFIARRDARLNADDTDAPELMSADLVPFALRRDDMEPPRDVSETSSIDVLSDEDA